MIFRKKDDLPVGFPDSFNISYIIYVLFMAYKSNLLSTDYPLNTSNLNLAMLCIVEKFAM